MTRERRTFLSAITTMDTTRPEYEILISEIMHMLYAERVKNNTPEINGLLDKAWRTPNNLRNYFGLKGTAAKLHYIDVPKCERCERQLLKTHFPV